MHSPKEAMVLMAVIVKLRLRLPPRSTVQMLEAPPAGEIPVKKKPNRIGTESRNSNSPIAYDNCEHANNLFVQSTATGLRRGVDFWDLVD